MKKFLLLFLLFVTSIGFMSCGKNKGKTDVELDDEGEIIVKPDSQVSNVTFWMYGDEVERNVFQSLVTEFNKINEGKIKVKMAIKAADGYTTSLNLALSGSTAPDVFYVSETGFKAMAENGYLCDITDYVAKSQDYNISEMWDSAQVRFKYDLTTRTSDGSNSKLYAVPKDIGPTVVFYNETMFNQSGIKVISVDASNLAAFNSGAKDDRGHTKAELGIGCEVKEKGYFVDTTTGQKWFNNQVPMSWEETVECSNVIQGYYNSSDVFGFFTEWWFNYGWSVGGDCIEYIESTDPQFDGGYWDFTLMDDSKNYIVKDNVESVTVNGTTYHAGEIIAYKDKLANYKPQTPGVMEKATKEISNEVKALYAEGKLNELPSQREAFTYFVRLAAKKSTLVEDFGDSDTTNDLYGYQITPYPSSIGNDAGKTSAFVDSKIAMLVDGRWNVTNFRQQLDPKGIKWDVAPLPQYKEYDENGDVLVHGIEAGHSGSVGVGIWNKSKVKNAAWKFIEFIGGRVGQTKQAETGFAIPLQKDIANTEVFLQSTQNPLNSKIFLKAAQFERPGDWWYLKDNEWINDWANVLNGSVRNGTKTLSDFYNDSKYARTYQLLLEYTKKK